jgi:hypothetical protein
MYNFFLLLLYIGAKLTKAGAEMTILGVNLTMCRNDQVLK